MNSMARISVLDAHKQKVITDEEIAIMKVRWADEDLQDDLKLLYRIVAKINESGKYKVDATLTKIV